jgi:hypothetical protein
VVVGDRDEAVDEALEVEIAEGPSSSGVSFFGQDVFLVLLGSRPFGKEANRFL